MLLLGNNGSWMSRDGARSWSRLSSHAQLGWQRAWNRTDLFVHTPAGVERTNDFGETTVRCGALPLDRPTGVDAVVLASDSAHVFAFIRTRGLFRSDDRCASWTAVAVPQLDPVFGLFAGAGYVVLRGYPSYLSRDGGLTWLNLRAVAEMDPIVISAGCDAPVISPPRDGRAPPTGHPDR